MNLNLSKHSFVLSHFIIHILIIFLIMFLALVLLLLFNHVFVHSSQVRDEKNVSISLFPLSWDITYQFGLTNLFFIITSSPVSCFSLVFAKAKHWDKYVSPIWYDIQYQLRVFWSVLTVVWFSVVDGGDHGNSDWSVATQPLMLMLWHSSHSQS